MGGDQLADRKLLPCGYPDDLQPIRVGDVFVAELLKLGCSMPRDPPGGTRARAARSRISSDPLPTRTASCGTPSTSASWFVSSGASFSGYVASSSNLAVSKARRIAASFRKGAVLRSSLTGLTSFVLD